MSLSAPVFPLARTLARRGMFGAVLLAVLTIWAGLAHGADAAETDSAAGAFSRLSTDSLASRVVTLSQLGLQDTVIGGAADARRQFYIPVPAGIPITDAALQMDAKYLRADGGRTTVLLSLDGTPVLGRSFQQEQGDASASVGVDGRARRSGYLRVGMAWTSVINDNICADQTANGNLMHVAPSSRFSYRFDTAAVNDLSTAWSALPQAPVLMVAGRSLDAKAFDTAWRAEALLERDGKHPLVQGLPKVGDAVSLGNLVVPPALKVFPSFAALEGPDRAGGSHKLATPAEVAAYIALASAAGFVPDVMVANDAMRTALSSSVDALRNEVVGQSSSPALAAAFDAWRKRFIQPLADPLAAGEVRLAHLGAQAIMLVGDPLAISILAQAWRAVDVSNRLFVHQLDTVVQSDTGTIAFSDLGGEPRALDVVDQAQWEANFDLAAASGNNRVPYELAFDFAAAPSPRNGAPIASIYFNDVLIGAGRITADGHSQRLTAHIPRYALAARNTVRVLFQRQPDATGCAARAGGYPVAVLPTSHLVLTQAGTDYDDDFTGMNVRFASHVNVLVPRAYLDDALASVPRIAGLADATGLSPARAVLSVIAPGGLAKPDGPFLAADVGLADQHTRAQVSQDRLKLTDISGRVLFDVSGLAGLGVIDVARSGSHPGVVYRTIGQRAPVMPPSLQLSRGDIAVFDGNGILKQIDTLHPDGIYSGNAPDNWRQIVRWAIPAGLIVLFILLLLLAFISRRRRLKKS